MERYGGVWSRDWPHAERRAGEAATSSERALSEAVGELERQGELQATVGDRMAEQLLGARDAVQDRVAVREETLGGAWRALALAQVDAQRLAQARGRGITPGEGPERRAHEVGHAARVLRHERRDLDVAVRRQPLAPACGGDEAVGGDRAVVASAKASEAWARRADGGADRWIDALDGRAQLPDLGLARRADPRPDGGDRRRQHERTACADGMGERVGGAVEGSLFDGVLAPQHHAGVRLREL